MTAKDEFFKKMQADYGKESIQPPGKKKIIPIPAISTGSPQLDIAIGIGGVPKGRLVEIFGPESAGKTTLVYEIIAQCQKEGGDVLFIDAEHSADPSYAKAIGVDWDALAFMQPDDGEQGLDAADRACKANAFDLIAIDSVAALTPRVILKGAVGDITVGAQARMMADATSHLKTNALKSNTAVVFTNQIREKIGVMFGSPETQPGGRSLKFYASLRLDIRRKETIGAGNDSTANRVKVKCVKNKVGKPYREAEFEIKFGEGIDEIAAILDMTTKEAEPGYVPDLIAKAGKFYTFTAHGGAKVGSRAEAIEFLRDNPEVAADLYNKILEANK